MPGAGQARAPDGVGVDADAEHAQPVREVMLPGRGTELAVPAPVEDVIDQDVQPTVIAIDPLS